MWLCFSNITVHLCNRNVPGVHFCLRCVFTTVHLLRGCTFITAHLCQDVFITLHLCRGCFYSSAPLPWMFLFQCTSAVDNFITVHLCRGCFCTSAPLPLVCFSVSAPLSWMCFSACQPCWLKGIVGVHIDTEHIMASCCHIDRGDNRVWVTSDTVRG